MKKIVCVLCALCSAVFSSAYASEEAAIQALEQSAQVEFVYVYFTALSGKLHQVMIPQKQFAAALKKGLKFDGSSVPGCVSIFESDMHLDLDPESFRFHPQIGNLPKTARVFANICQDEGIPHKADPRSLLQQALVEAEEAGCKFQMGVEMEFFFLSKDENGQIVPWDNGYYFGAESDIFKAALKIDLAKTLLDYGVVIEKLHHEVAAGQLEFSIKYSSPVKVADQIVLSKYVVEQVASKYGLMATFMPKPIFGVNGSGMHIHMSVADVKGGENLFFSKDGKSFLSQTANSCIAGVLKRAADGMLFLNSCPESFNRLVPGYEAPVYLCWAGKNRSALVRIPLFSEDEPYAARIEVRSPDASCNPYLGMAFLVKAGLAGILGEEVPPPANEENLFKLSFEEIQERGIEVLPGSFEEAVELFKNSSSLPELFDSVLLDEFIKLKAS